MKDYSTVELCRDWVADQLAGMRFLYKFPDAEVSHHYSMHLKVT